MDRDSTARLLGVAFCLCLVCSVLVSATAVMLKDRQGYNREIEKKRNILQIAKLFDPARPVEEQFKKVQVRIVDLERGRFAAVDPAAAGGHERQLYNIPADKDSAGIKTRPRYMEVYLVAEQGRLQQVVLPVYGKGLWSTMYGFIALGPDVSTVTGFGFYEHGETPGLGGEIDNPAWLAKWPGKMVYGQDGTVRITVIKGAVDSGSPEARHRIDGISGATITARGVGNLLAYWMGDDGYRSFLQAMRASGEVTP